MALSSVGHSCTCCIRDFDAGVRKVAKLCYSTQQEKEDRKHKSQLNKGLAAVAAYGYVMRDVAESPAPLELGFVLLFMAHSTNLGAVSGDPGFCNL